VTLIGVWDGVAWLGVKWL